jgi:LAS superfamily LD-carboxypeptidase LdcB
MTAIQKVEEIEKLEDLPTQTETPSTQACLKPNIFPQLDFFLEPVSPEHSIGLFIPENLVPLNDLIDTKYKFICLRSDAAYMLQTMNEAAKKDNVKLIVISAFRSFNYQEILKKNELPVAEHSYPSIADAGHSEHQLGTAIDFTSGTNPDYTFTLFEKSPEYAWLVEHAAEYGFIQSYQKGKEPITGYIAEPWHWRYVGPVIAKSVQRSEKTLYEYLLD